VPRKLSSGNQKHLDNLNREATTNFMSDRAFLFNNDENGTKKRFSFMHKNKKLSAKNIKPKADRDAIITNLEKELISITLNIKTVTAELSKASADPILTLKKKQELKGFEKGQEKLKKDIEHLKHLNKTLEKAATNRSYQTAEHKEVQKYYDDLTRPVYFEHMKTPLSKAKLVQKIREKLEKEKARLDAELKLAEKAVTEDKTGNTQLKAERDALKEKCKLATNALSLKEFTALEKKIGTKKAKTAPAKIIKKPKDSTTWAQFPAWLNWW
jgi:hypothetical protein